MLINTIGSPDQRTSYGACPTYASACGFTWAEYGIHGSDSSWAPRCGHNLHPAGIVPALGNRNKARGINDSALVLSRKAGQWRWTQSMA